MKRYRDVIYEIVGDLCIIHTRKIDLLPSFLYYQIEAINQKHKEEIQYVVFKPEPNTIYPVVKLKGAFSWDELR